MHDLSKSCRRWKPYARAYEKQNLDAVRKLMLPLKGFQRLEGQIQRDFDTYSTISLNITIERIYIQGERIEVNVRWEGEWQRSPEETPVTDRGPRGLGLEWHKGYFVGGRGRSDAVRKSRPLSPVACS